MATRNPSVGSSTDNNTILRAWIGEIHTSLAAFGLVQTADTGQVNLATVVGPLNSNIVFGYSVWRFADALQATAPVFFKIEYATDFQVNAHYSPALWLTVGQGSDGAGNITGRSTGRIQMATQNDDATTARACYHSGDSARCQIHMWRNSGNPGIGSSGVGPGNLFFSIERTHDASGANTTDGALVITSDLPNRSYKHQVLLFGAKSNPDGWNTGPVPAVGDGTASALDTGTGNIGVHPWQLPGRRGHEQACLGLVTYWRTDIAPDSFIVVPMPGGNRTYITLGSATNDWGLARAGCSGTIVHQSAMLALRYD